MIASKSLAYALRETGPKEPNGEIRKERVERTFKPLGILQAFQAMLERQTALMIRNFED